MTHWVGRLSQAKWFYKYLSTVYDHIVNPGHWTIPMRDDALTPAQLDSPDLKASIILLAIPSVYARRTYAIPVPRHMLPVAGPMLSHQRWLWCCLGALI